MNGPGGAMDGEPVTMTGTPRAPIRVAIVDDHQIFSDALMMRLQAEPDLDVVGTAGSPGPALALVSGQRVDVVTLDLVLGEADGLSLCRDLRRREPETAVVVVTGAADARRLPEAVRAGARGWVSKLDPVDRLNAVIRGVARGETHIPPDLLTHLLEALLHGGQASEDPRDGLSRLSDRERDVLACLTDGLSRREIGERLGVSPNTVRTHVQSILHKLEIHSALTAVAMARRSRALVGDHPDGTGAGGPEATHLAEGPALARP